LHEAALETCHGNTCNNSAASTYECVERALGASNGLCSVSVCVCVFVACNLALLFSWVRSKATYQGPAGSMRADRYKRGVTNVVLEVCAGVLCE
jgi:hypothetical protein